MPDPVRWLIAYLAVAIPVAIIVGRILARNNDDWP